MIIGLTEPSLESKASEEFESWVIIDAGSSAACSSSSLSTQPSSPKLLRSCPSSSSSSTRSDIRTVKRMEGSRMVTAVSAWRSERLMLPSSSATGCATLKSKPCMLIRPLPCGRAGRCSVGILASNSSLESADGSGSAPAKGCRLRADSRGWRISVFMRSHTLLACAAASCSASPPEQLAFASSGLRNSRKTWPHAADSRSPRRVCALTRSRTSREPASLPSALRARPASTNACRHSGNKAATVDAEASAGCESSCVRARSAVTSSLGCAPACCR
mmetsp:Transcript_7095/g.21841  ORF Transcript_7095/g.21841 Transcript_7095/m.21841 type:complete len:275 (-) Transcript_7095:1547-2371(-)